MEDLKIKIHNSLFIYLKPSLGPQSFLILKQNVGKNSNIKLKKEPE